ncbi:MAG: tetratricopeptide repeat protein [Thermoanaerobaculaceae bacterium]
MFKARVSLFWLLSFLSAATSPAIALPSAVPRDLERAWFQLTESFEPFDANALRDRTDELRNVAQALELQRLTPYAQALVLKARALPAENRILVLKQALLLDPLCPEALFELASLQFRRLHPAGLVSAGKALFAFFTDGRMVRFRDASLLLFLVLMVTLVGGFWAVFTVLQTIPRLWHDLMELANSWRMGVNSWVFASFVAGLPLFLALDPLWWAFYLFSLCWGYWPGTQKVLGLGLLVFLALTPLMVELGHRSFTHPGDPITRATQALQEKRYDPSALLELKSVGDLFGDDPDFYRLKGDLERQYGLYDASLLSYQEGLRLKPGDPALLLSAGIVQYLEGNFGAAVQLFTESRDRGFDPVIVQYNLSLAFAHVYNFRDSDEAMAAARNISAKRLRELTRGRDNKLIIPSFSVDDARAILGRKNPVVLLNRGLRLPPLSRRETLLPPLSLAAWTALLLAVLHFFWRQRRVGFASACSKCGRTFCSRCRLSRETQTYCSQCVNIFLRRDMVAPELQMAKQKQLARREKLLRLRRRLSDTLLPGFGLLLEGRHLLGMMLLLSSSVLMLMATFWLPGMVGPLMLHCLLWPIQAFLAVLWLVLFVMAQLAKPGEG